MRGMSLRSPGSVLLQNMWAQSWLDRLPVWGREGTGGGGEQQPQDGGLDDIPKLWGIYI